MQFFNLLLTVLGAGTRVLGAEVLIVPTVKTSGEYILYLFILFNFRIIFAENAEIQYYQCGDGIPIISLDIPYFSRRGEY